MRQLPDPTNPPTRERSLRGLLSGARSFSEDVFPHHAEEFRDLAHGQKPHTLFITCADSRIVPEMITQTDPGELFVLRNIGNLIPAYGEMLGGVSAVVEFAVTGLEVSEIVVCGHSDCGAMKALLDPGAMQLETMPTVKSWLRNAEAARSVVRATQPDVSGTAAVQALVEQNVILQLSHLRTHPSVAARLAGGKVGLHGWIYDIETGGISIIDESTRKLVSVGDALAALPPDHVPLAALPPDHVPLAALPPDHVPLAALPPEHVHDHTCTHD